MKKVRMAGTDLTLSRICLGTDQFGSKLSGQEAFRILDHFRDLGGNFLDTANIYGKWLPDGINHSERLVGQWLRERKAAQDMVVATKGGHYDLDHPGISRVTREGIRADLEESLWFLGLERIDFYWLHRDNPAMEMEELIGILEELVKEGKIRYYGASNFCLERLEEAYAYADTHRGQGFRAVSNQWSLAVDRKQGEASQNAATGDPTMVKTNRTLYEWHRQTGMPLVPYSSSAGGYFARLEAGQMSEGMAAKYDQDRNRKIFHLLQEESARCGISAFGLGQAFLLAQPFQVYPATAVSSPDQMAEFAAICGYEMPDGLAGKLLEEKYTNILKEIPETY